jgi:ATP-dependent DNA helicase RecG
MLVHADYRESSDTVIFQRDDGYLFRNPGDSWVNVRELGVQGRSERRNPGIAQLFDNLGLAEQAGSGYATILEEWQKLGYRPPVIHSDPGAYEFTLNLALRHLIDPDDRRWLQRLGEPWKPEEELALVFVRYEGRIDNATLRTKAGIEVLAASQILRSLRDRQFLVLHGNGKNAYYVPGSRLLGDQLPLDLEGDDESSGHNDESSGHNDESSGHNTSTVPLRAIAAPIAGTTRSEPRIMIETIVRLCEGRWLSSGELVDLLERDIGTVRRYLRLLVERGEIRLLYPQRNHPDQRYRSVVALEPKQDDA